LDKPGIVFRKAPSPTSSASDYEATTDNVYRDKSPNNTDNTKNSDQTTITVDPLIINTDPTTIFIDASFTSLPTTASLIDIADTPKLKYFSRILYALPSNDVTVKRILDLCIPLDAIKPSSYVFTSLSTQLLTITTPHHQLSSSSDFDNQVFTIKTLFLLKHFCL